MSKEGVLTNIIINTRFSAIHCWPGCDVPGMEYLRNPHHHEFHVQVKVPVNHDDRDVEFIDFKKDVDGFLHKFWNKDMGRISCENLCEEIMSRFPRVTYVRIMEDGENGAEKYKVEI